MQAGKCPGTASTAQPRSCRSADGVGNELDCDASLPAETAFKGMQSGLQLEAVSGKKEISYTNSPGLRRLNFLAQTPTNSFCSCCFLVV